MVLMWGISTVLVYLILTRPDDEALSQWLRDTLLWHVGLATVFGLALGYTAGRLLQWSEQRGLIKEDWRLVYTVALALIAIGAGRLIKSDEVLVVFAAGIMFTQVVSEEDREEEERGQEAVNRFFSIPIFALLGVAIPWQGWLDLGGALLLRRPPVLRPLLPSIRGRYDALYVGWFGPIAVAAIYYAAMMEHRLANSLIWEVVSLVICTSVVLHGITAAALTKWYGRHAPRPEERLMVDGEYADTAALLPWHPYYRTLKVRPARCALCPFSEPKASASMPFIPS